MANSLHRETIGSCDINLHYVGGEAGEAGGGGGGSVCSKVHAYMYL